MKRKNLQIRKLQIRWKLRKSKFPRTNGKRTPEKSYLENFRFLHRIICWISPRETATNAAEKWSSSARNWSRKNMNSSQLILKSMNSTGAYTAASAVKTELRNVFTVCLPARNAARYARTGREPSLRKHSFRQNTDTLS